MAKDKDEKKDEKKNPEKKIGRTAQDEGFKFGVNELADELDLEPASVRVKLRNLEIEKAGSVYGWNSEREFQEVVKKLKAGKRDKDEPEKKDEKKNSRDKVGDKKEEKGKGGRRGSRDEGREAR